MARKQSRTPAARPTFAPRAAPRRLPRSFFACPADELAPRLIGHRLVRVLDNGTRLAGIIVETEAYLGIIDRACHTFGGRCTPRNEQMYGSPGTAYVYFTYGMHFCMNVVCGTKHEGVAVLLRALAPIEGIETMCHNRGQRSDWEERDLCSGPAKLCKALAIDRTCNGIDLVESPSLFLEIGEEFPSRLLHRTTRIGIDGRGAWTNRLLRWYLRNSPHVSVVAKPRRARADRTKP